MEKNIVYVTTKLDDEQLWMQDVALHDVHWIREPASGEKLVARYRHLGPLVEASVLSDDHGKTTVSFSSPQRAITSGQSVVLYAKNECLGGGVVA